MCMCAVGSGISWTVYTCIALTIVGSLLFLKELSNLVLGLLVYYDVLILIYMFIHSVNYCTLQSEQIDKCTADWNARYTRVFCRDL